MASTYIPYSDEEFRETSEKLSEKLGMGEISERSGPGGRKVQYLETWKAIEQANRIFGFNGWRSQIVEINDDYIDEKAGGRTTVGYSAIIRVTLKDGSFHEDVGFGLAINQVNKGKAIELAKKKAVSDGVKRALKNFGHQLGLSIYDHDHVRQVKREESNRRMSGNNNRGKPVPPNNRNNRRPPIRNNPQNNKSQYNGGGHARNKMNNNHNNNHNNRNNTGKYPNPPQHKVPPPPHHVRNNQNNHNNRLNVPPQNLSVPPPPNQVRPPPQNQVRPPPQNQVRPPPQNQGRNHIQNNLVNRGTHNSNSNHGMPINGGNNSNMGIMVNNNMNRNNPNIIDISNNNNNKEGKKNIFEEGNNTFGGHSNSSVNDQDGERITGKKRSHNETTFGFLANSGPNPKKQRV